MDKDNIVFKSDNLVNQVQFAGREVCQVESFLRKKIFSNSFIHSRELHQCSRLIIYRKLCNNNFAIDKHHLAMDEVVKNMWINALLDNDNFDVMERDIYINDSSINLSCLIDCKIRILQEPCAFLFRSIRDGDTGTEEKNRPLMKDVIDLMCCLMLSQLYDGILIYQNIKPEIFHIKRSQKIIDGIVEKCKKINKFLLEKNIPNLCKNSAKQPCLNECGGSAKK